MPSIFAYYRPRGVRGNYIVAILLDLIETETATVSVARQRGTNCGHCGVQSPRIERNVLDPTRRMDEGQERRWEMYRIDQLIIGDTITIRIQDKDVIPYQETRYQAHIDRNQADGFYDSEVPFQMNNISFGVIKLNDIEVIDWDKSQSNTFGEARQRVRCLLLGETKDPSKQMKVGCAIEGEVVQIEPDFVSVLIDNGTRFVGILPTTEVLGSGVHVGNKIRVYLQQPETRSSYALLSINPAPGVIEQAEVVAAGAASKLEKPEVRTISLEEYRYAVNGEDASSNGHQVRYYPNDPLPQGRELSQRTKNELTERYNQAKFGQL